MKSRAVVIDEPKKLALRELVLNALGPDDLVVDVRFSGISTGTERLLYDGRMPYFPGLGYPLVPGYESVGVVVDAGPTAGARLGETVFVPGSQGFAEARGLFGGTADRVIVPSSRAVTIAADFGEHAVLLALAATAFHALHPHGVDAAPVLPGLIVGHGVVGRLLARLTLSLGSAAPVVWERQRQRRDNAQAYPVIDPADDESTGIACAMDASGDADILDTLMPKLARGGEIVLAGFYAERLGFAFPSAFMREARLRIAAEWQPADMQHVLALVTDGRLSLDGLVSHRFRADDAPAAYRCAFEDPESLKTILDWRAVQ